MSTHESNEWHRGVIYTVRPHILAPLDGNREYRILVGVRRMAGSRAPFTGYADLYRRASEITEARLAALICPEPPWRWTEWHGWRAIEIGERQLIFVFIATVVKIAGSAPAGEPTPTADDLSVPGGATLELLQGQGRLHIDEFYNDFDHRAAGDSSDHDILFSYGEYVPSAEGVDFEPFMRRAEAMARYHYGENVGVARRDSFCATHPDVAVVHVFFRV